MAWGPLGVSPLYRSFSWDPRGPCMGASPLYRTSSWAPAWGTLAWSIAPIGAPAWDPRGPWEPRPYSSSSWDPRGPWEHRWAPAWGPLGASPLYSSSWDPRGVVTGGTLEHLSLSHPLFLSSPLKLLKTKQHSKTKLIVRENNAPLQKWRKKGQPLKHPKIP